MRVGRTDHGNNRLLRGLVHLGDEIVLVLGLDLERAALERGAVDDRTGATRGLDRDVEHRMHGRRAFYSR
jgi:hypothetical protein